MPNNENIRIEMEVRAGQTIPSPVDNTLSIPGMAADAKATGDRLQEIESDFQATVQTVAEATATVQAYTEDIEANAASIQANAGGIAANSAAIQENAAAIEENKAAIQEIIDSGAGGIADAVAENTAAIRANAESIAANAQAIAEAQEAIGGKLDKPTNDSQPGMNGWTLTHKSDGSTQWSPYGLPGTDQVESALADWLADHPDAVTSVYDGSISKVKLNSDLQGKTDLVSDSIAPAYEDLIFPVPAGSHCRYNSVLYVAVVDIATSEEWTAGHWAVATIGDALSSLPAKTDKSTIAPEYNALTFPVSAWQPCWHEGTLYRAKQAIPASESWTASHWEASVIGNDLAARIDSLEGALGNAAHKKTSGDYTWEIGKIITVNGNENTGAGFATTEPVPAADVPSIINTTGDVGYNSKATIFYLSEYDQNGNWISPRHTLIDGEPYTFSANCAAYRITYGYQAAAGVTMTQAILAEYFSASTLEEGATKSEVQAINQQIADYVTDAPAGYTRVESLASTVGGGQYCSMGRKLNQDSRIVLTFALTQLERSGLEYICGARYASGNNEMTIGLFVSNRLRIGYGDAYASTDVIINDTNPHTVDVNKNAVYFDGSLVETLTYETFETEGSGYLFGITSHTGTSYSAVKILRCLVYDNGTLVSDYIPVINVSTGLGGMYDLVQHSFKRNPSETPLVAGPVQSIPNNAERIGALEGAMGSAQEAISANASSIDGTNVLINVIHGFVNYGYDTPANLAPNATSQDEKAVGIQRNGTTVILNGTNNTSSNKNIVLRLNGSVTRTTSGATIEGWEGIELKPGQKYTFTSKLIEGTIVDENGDSVPYMQLGVVTSGTRSSVGTYTFSGNAYERTFTAEEDASYVFSTVAKAGYSYTNAKAMITLSESSGGGSGGGVSPYIQAEADRVAEKVRNVQTGKTLTFIACSDLHYLDGNATVNNALVDMRDGIKAIAGQTHVDFYTCFGDIIYRLAASTSTTSFDTGKTEIIAVTKLLNDAFGIAPQIRIVGNHDPNCEGATGYFTPDQLNSFIGIYSNMLEKAESMPNQGVGYHDFDRQKIRVIVINTSYYESAPTQGKTRYYLGPAQTQIMCQMMDLSAKADADEWQIMIFAHIVLDDAGNPQQIGRYSAAINAYINGTTWGPSDGYSYDFSGKNAASLAVYVNGHAHKYRVKNTRHMNASGEVQRVLSLPQLYVPNALPDRDEESMDGVTYTKTAKTAESTAFQVITIDPESKTVYAHHWGAGIDMILHYDPTEETSFSTDLTSPTWASNDAEIATVSEGAVTPVAEGYVIIWAKSEADNCIECWNYHSVV